MKMILLYEFRANIKPHFRKRFTTVIKKNMLFQEIYNENMIILEYRLHVIAED